MRATASNNYVSAGCTWEMKKVIQHPCFFFIKCKPSIKSTTFDWLSHWLKIWIATKTENIFFFRITKLDLDWKKNCGRKIIYTVRTYPWLLNILVIGIELRWFKLNTFSKSYFISPKKWTWNCWFMWG